MNIQQTMPKTRFSTPVTFVFLDTREDVQARNGEFWMQQARDRARFKRRIMKFEEIFVPILLKKQFMN